MKSWGPLPDNVGQAGQGIRASDAVMEIGIKADAQLPGGGRQGHKRISGSDAVWGAWSKADVSFTDAAAGG